MYDIEREELYDILLQAEYLQQCLCFCVAASRPVESSQDRNIRSSGGRGMTMIDMSRELTLACFIDA